MARLFAQYLAINNNENLPDSKTFAKLDSKLLKTPSKILPKTIKILPLWQNFAKSGHTAGAIKMREQMNVVVSRYIFVNRVGGGGV